MELKKQATCCQRKKSDRFSDNNRDPSRAFSAQRSRRGPTLSGDYNQTEMLKLAEELRRNQLSKMNYSIQQLREKRIGKLIHAKRSEFFQTSWPQAQRIVRSQF